MNMNIYETGKNMLICEIIGMGILGTKLTANTKNTAFGNKYILLLKSRIRIDQCIFQDVFRHESLLNEQ